MRLLLASVLALLVVGTSPARAQRSSVEISGFPRTSAAQRSSQWCWAATLESVFRFYGVERTQEQIVLATYGQLVDLGARDPQQLYSVLNSTSFSSAGRVQVTTGSFGTGAPPVGILLAELSQRHPVIAWYATGPGSGHAVVIFGASSVPGPWGPVVDVLRIWDPMPGAGVIDVPGAILASRIYNFFVVRRIGQRTSAPSRSSSPPVSPSTPRRRDFDAVVSFTAGQAVRNGLEVGDRCNVVLRVLDEEQMECRATIECEGVRYYGHPVDAGYTGVYDCSRLLESTIRDRSSSSIDRDPSLTLEPRVGAEFILQDMGGSEGTFQIHAHLVEPGS